MSGIINRRIERFQSKLQQRVNLADDEIARLNNYYASVMAEITDAKDQLARLNRISDQQTQKLTGTSKKEIAEHNAEIATLKAKHEQTIIELQEAHVRQIMDFQRDFEATLKQVDKWADSCVEQKTASINAQLERTNVALDKTKQTLASTSTLTKDTEMQAATQSLEYETDRIQRLEEKLKQKNQDRLDMLMGLKMRLNECIATLEETENNHSNEMSSYIYKLDAVDKKYEERMNKEAEKHEKEQFALKRQLEALKRKIASYQTQMEKMSIRAREQISSIEQESSQVLASVRISSANAITSISSEVTDVMASTKSLQQTEKLLAEKENELLRARTDNESLKREIARLHHEALIKERRAARK